MPEAKNPKTASQTRKRTQRTDLTANRRQQAQENLTKEQEEEQARMATAAVEKEIEDSTTIDDYTGQGVTPEEMAEHGVVDVEVHEVGEQPYVPPVEEVDDLTIDESQIEIDTSDVKVEESAEIIRPREDCQFMMGAGNHYRFSAGRAAKVPTHVAAHMREKGLLW